MGSYVLVLGPLPSYFTQDPPVPKRRILDLSCTPPPTPFRDRKFSCFPRNLRNVSVVFSLLLQPHISNLGPYPMRAGGGVTRGGGGGSEKHTVRRLFKVNATYSRLVLVCP